MTLQIVQDEAADEVLSTNAFALLCGMMLFQQAPVDVAFAGPAKILDRFGSLDPVLISEAPAEEFAELCATEPAVHPYPESMAVLVQALARFIVVNYDADTAAVWNTAGSGDHLLSRVTLMPGIGRRKAQMFVALLGRQLDVRPPGWERAAGPYAQEGRFRSVADIHDRDSLNRVLAGKTGRRQGDREAGDGRPAERTSAITQEGKGLIKVNTEEETVSTDSGTSYSDTADGSTTDGSTTDGSTTDGSTTDSDTMSSAATDSDSVGSDEKRAARKAARKAARQAQRREARQVAAGSGPVDPSDEGRSDADESADYTDTDTVGDVGESGGDVGELAVDAKEKLTPEQRAERQAKKAEKRAARRAAAGKDPEGEGGRGAGRRGGRSGRGGRGGRDRSNGVDSENVTGTGSDDTVSGQSGTPTDGES